jgi:hypothetical protein
LADVRLGIAHHHGWAVAVTADGTDVVDRRRIELLGPGLPAAPIHHEGGQWAMHGTDAPSDDELAALVAKVRASAVEVTTASLDALPFPITSLHVRAWPVDFPADVAVLRRPPYESRADSVMYCQVLAECAAARGWSVHQYDAKAVEALVDPEVLSRPRAVLGPPWTKDHRQALAATLVG